jgi:hypothetical protein
VNRSEADSGGGDDAVALIPRLSSSHIVIWTSAALYEARRFIS